MSVAVFIVRIWQLIVVFFNAVVITYFNRPLHVGGIHLVKSGQFNRKASLKTTDEERCYTAEIGEMNRKKNQPGRQQ